MNLRRKKQPYPPPPPPPPYILNHHRHRKRWVDTPMRGSTWQLPLYGLATLAVVAVAFLLWNNLSLPGANAQGDETACDAYLPDDAITADEITGWARRSRPHKGCRRRQTLEPRARGLRIRHRQRSRSDAFNPGLGSSQLAQEHPLGPHSPNPGSPGAVPERSARNGNAGAYRNGHTGTHGYPYDCTDGYANSRYLPQRRHQFLLTRQPPILEVRSSSTNVPRICRTTQ